MSLYFPVTSNITWLLLSCWGLNPGSQVSQVNIPPLCSTPSPQVTSYLPLFLSKEQLLTTAASVLEKWISFAFPSCFVFSLSSFSFFSSHIPTSLSIKFPSAALAVLELAVILLPQPPGDCDYRHKPRHSATWWLGLHFGYPYLANFHMKWSLYMTMDGNMEKMDGRPMQTK